MQTAYKRADANPAHGSIGSFHARGVEIEVTAGPMSKWIDSAKQNADLIFSGSEVMMSDFIEAMPDIDPQTVEPLYLRESAILVRPGNPNHISGVADLLKPGHSILIVNGAGPTGTLGGRCGALGRHRQSSGRSGATSREWRRTAPRQKRRGWKTRLWTLG